MAVVAHAHTTLSNVKSFLGITGTSNDALLEKLIDNITEWVEGQLSGRRIKKTTYTNELHDGGEHDIFLFNWPIIQPPTLIAEFRSGPLDNPTFQAFQTNAFFVYEKAGFVHFLGRTPGRHFHGGFGGIGAGSVGTPSLGAGHQNLRFTFDAGFTKIPDDLELLAKQLVAKEFGQKQSQGKVVEAVEGTRIEWAGIGRRDVRITLTHEQQLVLSRYKRHNVGQNL